MRIGIWIIGGLICGAIYGVCRAVAEDRREAEIAADTIARLKANEAVRGLIEDAVGDGMSEEEVDQILSQALDETVDELDEEEGEGPSAAQA